MGARRAEKGAVKAASDYQEQAALKRAVAAMQRFAPGTPDSVAAVAISEWILARASMCASRMNLELRFDLKDSRLRGFIEAALPAIGANLSHLPADRPLFDLDKAQVVDVIMAGIQGAQEAAVAANESLGFPFDDEIPFGSPIRDEELSH